MKSSQTIMQTTKKNKSKTGLLTEGETRRLTRKVLPRLAVLVAQILLAAIALTPLRGNSTEPMKQPKISPIYQEVFGAVDQGRLISLLKDLSGENVVTVGGESFRINERYSAEGKRKFRAYFKQYFQNLGVPVQEMAYPTQITKVEQEGHNVEAVIQGQSKDSIVIIVHYDSMGPDGQETSNPGADDCMTGMAVSLETARILLEHKAQLKNTVRIVASDFEEHAFPGLEGARKYAAYIQNKARAEGFKIVSAVDNEQSGWNCAKTGQCRDNSAGDVFDVFSCGGSYNFPELGTQMENIASSLSKMKVSRGCMGQNSDHYAMWEIGVPALVYSEHSPFDNDHFDQQGGNTFDKIDQDYFFKIAQIGVTFAAQMAGLE